MNKLKQLCFRLTTRMFWHPRQPIEPVFHNNINRFMYFLQQRLLQCFLFRIRSHICLFNNTTNTRRRIQSTLPPTECRVFGTFDPFCTFHPSLHESVVRETREVMIKLQFTLISQNELFISTQSLPFSSEQVISTFSAHLSFLFFKKFTSKNLLLDHALVKANFGDNQHKFDSRTISALYMLNDWL